MSPSQRPGWSSPDAAGEIQSPPVRPATDRTLSEAAPSERQHVLNKRGLVIVNPHARRGRESIDGILDHIRARGLELDVALIGEPSRIPDVIAAASDTDSVIVCGGDGTLSTALRGVLRSGATLGVLPMGTANDLALTLGIPADLKAAADVIVAGRTRSIDVGTVNGHPFFNVASLGISGKLAANLCGDGKRRWGRLSYVLATLRALVQSRPFSAQITEGETTTRARSLQIAVGNGRHYGGGNVVAPDAGIDDGRIDLYSLEVDSAWKLVLMAPYFRAGQHGCLNSVRTARGTAFDVSTRKRRTVTADGERVTHTPARFRILPGAVRIYAPHGIAASPPR